jgi:hypothetical protein
MPLSMFCAYLLEVQCSMSSRATAVCGKIYDFAPQTPHHHHPTTKVNLCFLTYNLQATLGEIAKKKNRRILDMLGLAIPLFLLIVAYIVEGEENNSSDISNGVLNIARFSWQGPLCCVVLCCVVLCCVVSCCLVLSCLVCSCGVLFRLVFSCLSQDVALLSHCSPNPNSNLLLGSISLTQQAFLQLQHAIREHGCRVGAHLDPCACVCV